MLNSVNVDSEHRRIQEETWEAALQANKQRTLENNIRLSNMIRRADVTEVYSQPRIAKACMESGLTEGSSLVLGTGSDLSIPKQQKMAIQLIMQESPKLFVGYPPCRLQPTESQFGMQRTEVGT